MLINDHFQNYKSYITQKAQLIIADIPYNVGKNAYGSNPAWYVDGDNKNGESKLANSEFFDTDKDFRMTEFLHFCTKMLKKEPKATPGGKRGENKSPCMIVFCSFEQQFELIEKAKDYGLNHYINLVFRKNFSAQVLKANMRIVGNAEYAILLYRDKLPKFNNKGKMVFNIFDWEKDSDSPKIHPVAGSGSSLVAAEMCHRKYYGFEIKKNYFAEANKWIEQVKNKPDLFKPVAKISKQHQMNILDKAGK